MADPEALSANQSRPEEFSPEDYFAKTIKHTSGPQIEGLAPEELSAAVQDPETEFIKTADGTTLPLCAKLDYASWLNKDFFDAKGYQPDSMRYCLLPQDLLREELGEAPMAAKLREIIGRKDSLSLLIDYPESSEPFYKRFPVPHTVDLLTTENGTPAATYHYRTKLKARQEEMGVFNSDPAIRTVTPDEVDRHFERVWEIYNLRFKTLVDDHPIAGEMPKETLLATLKSPDTHLAAYFDDDQQIQSFGYVVSNLDLCPWLNQEYFRAEAEGLPLVYMPGIASSPNAMISTSTKIMNFMLKKQLDETPDFVLTFECSNKSATYIPKLVKRAFDQSGLVDYKEFPELKHYYRVVNFNAQPSESTS